jgi:hypothetical protein
MKRMSRPFHVGPMSQSMHHDLIWCKTVTHNFSQIQKHGTTSSLVKAEIQSSHPQHMNDVTPCICMKRMWRSFHVSLEPQSLHHDCRSPDPPRTDRCVSVSQTTPKPLRCRGRAIHSPISKLRIDYHQYCSSVYLSYRRLTDPPSARR